MLAGYEELGPLPTGATPPAAPSLRLGMLVYNAKKALKHTVKHTAKHQLRVIARQYRTYAHNHITRAAAATKELVHMLHCFLCACWYNGLQKSGPEALEGDIIFRKVYSKDGIFIQEKFALETTFSSLRVANGKITGSLVNY